MTGRLARIGETMTGNPVPYIICQYCGKSFPESQKVTCYTIHPGSHSPCMMVFHDERCQEFHRRDMESEGKK